MTVASRPLTSFNGCALPPSLPLWSFRIENVVFKEGFKRKKKIDLVWTGSSFEVWLTVAHAKEGGGQMGRGKAYHWFSVCSKLLSFHFISALSGGWYLTASYLAWTCGQEGSEIEWLREIETWEQKSGWDQRAKGRMGVSQRDGKNENKQWKKQMIKQSRKKVDLWDMKAKIE